MIVTAVDDRFLTEATPLIHSCARNAPDQGFYLFLVNSTEQKVKPLRDVHPKLIVEHVQWRHEPARWRGIMCSARSIPILELLETHSEPTVYLDSDTLLVAPPDELFSLLEKHELLVDYRPQVKVAGAGGTLHGGTFNSGVIAIRPTENTIQMFREYNRILREWVASDKALCKTDESCGVQTCIDQEFLYTTYERFSDRIDFRPLPKKFNDAKFRPDSVVWHGKGTARKNPEYVLAKLSYGQPVRYAAFCLVAYPFLSARWVYRMLLGRGGKAQ